MRWLKAILGIILVFFLMENITQLVAGKDASYFTWATITGWVIPGLFIALILSASVFIFASELPKRKKVMWMWLSFPGYIIAMVLIFFLFYFLVTGRFISGGLVLVPFIIAGIALVVLPVITGIFWFLLRFNEHKQVKILIGIIIFLLILFIVQIGVLKYNAAQEIQQAVGPGACEKIQDLEGSKDRCYTQQASFYRDPSYCELVQEQRTKERCQKYCC